GPYNSPESRQRYERVIAEWFANGRTPLTVPDVGPAVVEILVPFLERCDRYYRRADGRPPGEAANIRLALQPLRELYVNLPAREFGKLQLKAVRQRLIDSTYRGSPFPAGWSTAASLP